MRRKIFIALLALGTLGGYASGFCHLRAHRAQQEQSFERHVADVCLEAAASRK